MHGKILMNYTMGMEILNTSASRSLELFSLRKDIGEKIWQIVNHSPRVFPNLIFPVYLYILHTCLMYILQ